MPYTFAVFVNENIDLNTNIKRLQNFDTTVAAKSNLNYHL